MYSPDDVFINRYRIRNYLGTEESLQSYKAYDLEQCQDVILAILPQLLATSQPGAWQAMRQRMQEETALSKRLQHPNIVSVLSLAQTPDGDLYQTRQDFGGENLADVMNRDLHLPAEQVLRIGRDLCSALRPIIAQGIPHGVIIPENVIISSDHAWLSGLGTTIGQTSASPSIGDGNSLAAPGYPVMDYRGSEGRVTEQDDISALGALMFKALTGQVYNGQDIHKLELPPALRAVLERTWLPASRGYPNILALEQDLTALERQSFLGEVAILVRHAGTVAIVVIMGLLLLLVLLIGLLSIAATLRNLPMAVQREQDSITTQTASMALLAWPTSITDTQTSTITAAQARTITATPEGEVVDIYEPDDANPAPIEPGDEQKRTFSPDNDIDRVAFRVKAGNSYILQTMNLAAGVNTVIEILAGGKSYLSEATNDGETARVLFTALVDGTAIAAITNKGMFNPQSTYTLVLLELPRAASQTPSLEPSVTPNSAATSKPRPTYTPAGTLAASPTRTAMLTTTATATATASPTATSTATATATATLTVTPSPTHTASPTHTETPSHTPTLTPTVTETPTSTPLPPDNRETPIP